MTEFWTGCSDIQYWDLVIVFTLKIKLFGEFVIIDIRRRWCIRVLLVLQMVVVSSDSHSIPQYTHSWAWGMFFILVKFTPEYYKYINIFQGVQSNLF